MNKILTVTLNPALDISTTVSNVRPEEKLRCTLPLRDTGGGGVNVARAIGELGGLASAFLALAGHTGAHFLELLADEPLAPVVYHTPGETRQSLSVIDETTKEQFRFVMPGPHWTETLSEGAIAKIAEAAPVGGYVVLSGSQPPGVSDQFPARLAAAVAGKGAMLVLDTSGPPLHALLDDDAVRPHVLRLDGAESAELAGRPLITPAEVAEFAEGLIARDRAEIVVLAMGPDGSVLVTRNGRWHANTADVPVVSKVGAGDSFVGAFTLALERGLPPEDALIWGCAGASAAVMTDATALCRRSDVEALVNSAVRIAI